MESILGRIVGISIIGMPEMDGIDMIQDLHFPSIMSME